jgi:hypothetical protein
VSLLLPDGGTEQLSTTPGHSFWVEGQGWTPAHLLLPGQTILTAPGHAATILASESIAHPDGIIIYNFTVEASHTYFVDDGLGDIAAVWVHNKRRRRVVARLKQAGGPEFGALKDHAHRHARPGQSTESYYREAFSHMHTGRAFQVRHDGTNKTVFLTRKGAEFLFTSTSLSGKRAFTHMVVDKSYLKSKGIVLPNRF